MTQQALPSSHPPTRRSRPWRHAAAALLIFAGGIACGAVGAAVVIKHAVRHAFEHPDAAVCHVTSRLASFLDLNDKQAEQVRDIIVRRHAALADIRRDIQPRLESELTILEKEIADVLNDQQKVLWHEHAAKFRAQWLPPLPPSGPAPDPH